MSPEVEYEQNAPAGAAPPPATAPPATTPPATVSPPAPFSIEDQITAAADFYHVPRKLALAIAKRETKGYDQNAISPKGAIGIMQLTAPTAKAYNVDPYNPDENILGGMRYLRDLIKHYKTNTRLIAAAYNAGEPAVDKYGGVPPFEETQRYADFVEKLVGPTLDGATPTTTTPPGQPETLGNLAKVGQQIGVAIAPPIRPMAGGAANMSGPDETSYDPVYGDPELGMRTYSKASMLHKLGFAIISSPMDWVSKDGKQKVTAVQINSPQRAQVGLWTEDGRKLDPSKGWRRTGIGGGGAGGTEGLKPFEHLEGVDPDTGVARVYAFDPMTAVAYPMPISPLDRGGKNLKYMYNYKRKEFNEYAGEALTTLDPRTGIVTNYAGDRLEEALRPAQVAAKKQQVDDKHWNDWQILKKAYYGWQQGVDKGELMSRLDSFGIAPPPDYAGTKAEKLAALKEYYQDQQDEIERRYVNNLNNIRLYDEHEETPLPFPKPVGPYRIQQQQQQEQQQPKPNQPPQPRVGSLDDMVKDQTPKK